MHIEVIAYCSSCQNTTNKCTIMSVSLTVSIYCNQTPLLVALDTHACTLAAPVQALNETFLTIAVTAFIPARLNIDVELVNRKLMAHIVQSGVLCACVHVALLYSKYKLTSILLILSILSPCPDTSPYILLYTHASFIRNAILVHVLEIDNGHSVIN